MGFLTVPEALAEVAHREKRLALALEGGRDGHVERCRQNLEGARWRLRHAERLAKDEQEA